MTGVDNGGQHTRRRIIAAHADHLIARHHDVAGLQIGHLQHPFEHGVGVSIEQTVLLGFTQAVEQLIAITRPGQRTQAAPPAPGSGLAYRTHARLLRRVTGVTMR